jgi:ectoine hydroxylase-related dioxygenase (phytanoyl-CoA dioxygenase family)
MNMTEDEKYLFDLTGYLVLKDVLSPMDLARCNEAIDHHLERTTVANPEEVLSAESKTLAGPGKQHYLDHMLQWERPWCEPFRELLLNPRIVSCLDVILRKEYRLDAGPMLVLAADGAEGLVLHGGGVESSPSMSYFYQHEKFYCGMIVVEVMLADEGPGDGGLALIPGSHKANFPCPRPLKLADKYASNILEVNVKAGDAVIFLETTVHGTLPWKGKQSRRALLHRYTPGYMNYHDMKYDLTPQEFLMDMTPEQRAMLEPPNHRKQRES